MMKCKWLVALVPALFLSGCLDELFPPRVRKVEGGGPQPAPPAADKPRVFVADFVDETGVDAQFQKTGASFQAATPGGIAAAPGGKLTIRNPIGYGMKAQLKTALSRTRCFRLFDTPSPPDGLGIDYEISGSVTEYQPSEKSMAGGVGWSPRQSAILPGLRGADPLSEPGRVLSNIIRERVLGGFGDWDHVAIDVTLTNARTREYWSMAFEGKGTSAGIAMAAEFGRWVLDWGAQRQASIQKVIRACIDAAAVWVARQTIPYVGVPVAGPRVVPVPPKERPLPPPPAPTRVAVVVEAEKAVIRELPGEESPEVLRVKRGIQLEKIQESGAWTKVRLGSVEGWVLTTDIGISVPGEESSTNR